MFEPAMQTHETWNRLSRMTGESLKHMQCQENKSPTAENNKGTEIGHQSGEN